MLKDLVHTTAGTQAEKGWGVVRFSNWAVTGWIGLFVAYRGLNSTYATEEVFHKPWNKDPVSWTKQ